MSKAAVGQALTARACIPSTSDVVVAGQLGKLRPSSVTVIMALGSSTHAPYGPRGPWYLKLRPMIRTPFTNSVDASVSP